jgi:hypothetical protein
MCCAIVASVPIRESRQQVAGIGYCRTYTVLIHQRNEVCFSKVLRRGRVSLAQFTNGGLELFAFRKNWDSVPRPLVIRIHIQVVSLLNHQTYGTRSETVSKELTGEEYI